MIQSGLRKIKPHTKDDHFLPSFGAPTYDVADLPKTFSLYDNRPIPNQNREDTRFTPSLSPMPYGCTGETTTFICGLQDKKLYNPQYTYSITPPYDNGGRDIRDSLKTTIDTGLKDDKGVVGGKRTRYGHVYASGKIDDFDAQRIALYLNQRAISVGTFWYPEFMNAEGGYLPVPSFDMKQGSLHNYAIVGWTTLGEEYLEVIPWIGQQWAWNGRGYISRAIFNKLINQPYTGSFVLYDLADGKAPTTLGFQAILDNITAFIRNLFHV